ncbi:MAG TPA: PAS domain-containing protein [Nitrospirae bacterium]|nr:Wide host range VirA protein [bacterium BMS3Abin06]HDH13649.1 PAS domain-containing protein [Nitrospirota bacterium]HDZ00895.1 PAS domain-containing protein [Nitrospirota bacterium]
MKNKFNIPKALLINKNIKDSRLFEQAFQHHCPSAGVIMTQDAQQGIEILSGEKIDTVFIDYDLSISNQNFFREIQKINLYIPVIVLVEKGKELDAAEAIKRGAFDYILKDADYIDSLPDVLERIQSSILKKEKDDELQRQSLLFKQIYRSQKWWQHIIDAITDYLFVINQDCRILRTNKAFANLFGKEPADIIMKPYYELFGLEAPHEWCVMPKGKDGYCPRSLERELNNVVYLISCFPIYFDEHEAVVYILKDITETRRLKDQVYHLDKLSSLGTLTSGVAHEINNPLTGIIGYTEMLLMKNGDETTRKYLQNIYDSAIRCKRIVENMLTFSRQTPSQIGVEDINDIIDKTIELHEYWLKSTNIEIIRNYAEVPSVAVDRQQMQQVILNLLINAEHAIAEADRRGRIEFETAYDDNSKQTVITVSDNGKGIPQEILPKIFDPFFTTKPVNKGTGLGLSIAHGIIAEQGGTIEAKSVPGEGTSFIIRLSPSK